MRATKFEGRHEYEIGFDIAEEDKPTALRFLQRVFAGREVLTMQG